MKNMKITHDNVQLAGFGNPIQWGAVIGIAIDKYSGNVIMANDDGIRDAIKAELENGGLDVPAIDTLPSNQVEAINRLLKETTTNMSSEDLKALF